MAYFIRAFCVGETIPSIGEIIRWLESQNVPIRAGGGEGETEQEKKHWDRASLVYGDWREPIVANCLACDGEDGAAKLLIERFINEIGKAGRSAVKKRVINHLNAATFVIALDVPAWDMDDKGWDANGQILTYLLDNCGALIQADGEGFYEGDKLILRIEATG